MKYHPSRICGQVAAYFAFPCKSQDFYTNYYVPLILAIMVCSVLLRALLFMFSVGSPLGIYALTYGYQSLTKAFKNLKFLVLTLQEVFMKLCVDRHDVEVTLISRDKERTWIGILIDLDIRTIETVVCFKGIHVYHYFAYGCQNLAYEGVLYKSVIKILRNPEKLAEV